MATNLSRPERQFRVRRRIQFGLMTRAGVPFNKAKEAARMGTAKKSKTVDKAGKKRKILADKIRAVRSPRQFKPV